MPTSSWFAAVSIAAGLGVTALPEQVAQAFSSAFPNARASSVDAEKEGGLTVYEIEFTEDGVRRECEMTADGTILSSETAIDLFAVPDVVKQAFVKAADGGTIGAVEYEEIRAEARHGKIVALDTIRIEYEAVFTKGDRTGEVTVANDGKIVEGPTWFKPGEDDDED
jgi:hypothetical protein